MVHCCILEGIKKLPSQTMYIEAYNLLLKSEVLRFSVSASHIFFCSGIPSTLSDFMPWLTADAPESVTGVNPLECLVFLPGLNVRLEAAAKISRAHFHYCPNKKESLCRIFQETPQNPPFQF